MAIGFIWVAPLLSGILGKFAYLIFYTGGIAVLFVLIVRQSYKDFPNQAAATSERSVVVHSSFKQVCEMVPQAVKNCSWKLLQADEDKGHFTAKIGMSRKTWWQIMYINLRQVNQEETNVDVRCVAPHVLWDRGQNNKMIDKFGSALERLLTLEMSSEQDKSAS